jgi:hypothetical protein
MFPLKRKNLKMISTLFTQTVSIAKEILFAIRWRNREYEIRNRKRRHYTNLWKF